MTISSTTVKNSYSGNGSTTAFAYTFKIFANTDLQVIIRSSTGTETVKTLTTHYTVSGVGDASGGNVTFTSGNIPASGETVVIRRAVPQTQAIDYIANDPFPAESHEEGLDRATMTTQQVQEELDRSLKLSRTNTMTSTEFTVGATDRANKVLSFDSSGELSVTQELGTFKGDWSSGTAYVIRDLVKDTSTNNIFIVNTAHTASGSEPLTTNANSAKYDLIVDAASATTSASNAATSATAAASSATAAASSASSASTQASNASTSASNAASSATAAAASATDAANSADAFDDIYLGSKSSDPSTDNDGDALAAGMLYFNTTDDLLRVYTGSAWQNAAVDTTGFITVSGTQTLTNKTLTSPKIGTALLDTNGNELAKVTATSSAVNEFTVANAATGNGPRISVTGDDSNVDLDLLAKGTGHVTVRGNTNSGAIQLNCEVNTHGQQIKAQPHSAGVTNSMLLPAGADSTLVSLVSTDTLTNKTLTSPKIGTKIDDTNGNELVNLTATGSAVNEFTIANAATGNNPVLSATGGDSNVGIEFTTKGTGTIKFNDLAYIPQQALTSSSNAVAWDTQAKPNAYHLTTENTTFAAPTNNTEGSFICLEINYNGSHTIAFNTVFEFAASTAPTFTSTDGKTDILVFRYNGSVWQEVGRTLNLSES
nr:putative tail fiber [uncultured Mediterranean phage uvMED]